VTIDHDLVKQSGIYNAPCEEFIPQLPDRSIDCIITDPPYGVDFVSRRAETAAGKKWVRPVENDKDLTQALEAFANVLALLESKVKEECDVYVFTRWDIVGEWIELIRNCDWLSYKMLLVWDKGIPGMGDIDSNWGCGHELVLYCKRGRREVAYRRSSIVAVDKVHAARLIHPTEKPVPLLEHYVEMSTKPGDVVFDPFSGSGSTSVAADRLGRIGIGTEVDAEHHRRSLDRLAQGSLF
jgi:adenine-specific DNA-methyltransferase